MNYRHVYMLIIKHAKSEMELGLRPKSRYEKRYKFSECYSEFHHILPKSLFPNWSKRKSNLVALTAREHFFCHQLLVKIYPTYEMWGALFRLSKDGRGDRNVTSREYENIRSNFSRLQSEKKKGYKPWNTGITNVYSDVYCDTTGLPFCYFILKHFGHAKITAYTHYPFISYDMISQVQSNRAGVHSRGAHNKNNILKPIKFKKNHVDAPIFSV